MTTHDKDKIIAAAKEVDPAINEETVDFLDEDGIEKLTRFYAIAFEAGRQAEREDCAKVCMQQCSVIEEPHEFERYAEAIRARSTK